MKQKKITFLFIAIGVLLILGGLLLVSATPAQAQCGSQASSCKNCHESQGQKPVNNDGTTWHTQHAFGDFCYLCHGGNNQSTDETASHAGMTAPLADINVSCQSCHPSDTLAKAQVYATTLGVQVGTGGETSPSGQPAASAPTEAASATQAVSAPLSTQLDVNDPNLVNYKQQYDISVLGIRPTNWGNVILVMMILMFAVGGGGFVLYNEKLVKVSFGDTKKVEREYPRDVVEMLPRLSKLKPQARKSLGNILSNPKSTARLLNLVTAVLKEEKEKE